MSELVIEKIVEFVCATHKIKETDITIIRPYKASYLRIEHKGKELGRATIDYGDNKILVTTTKKVLAITLASEKT